MPGEMYVEPGDLPPVGSWWLDDEEGADRLQHPADQHPDLSSRLEPESSEQVEQQANSAED